MKKLIRKYWYIFALYAVGILTSVATLNLRGAAMVMAVAFLAYIALNYFEKWKEVEKELERVRREKESITTRAAYIAGLVSQKDQVIGELRRRFSSRVEGLPIAVIGHLRAWNRFSREIEFGSKKSFVYMSHPEELAGREIAGVILLADHDLTHRGIAEQAVIRVRVLKKGG